VESHDGRQPGQSPEPDLPARVPRRIAGSSAAPAPEPKRRYKPDRAWDKLLLLVGAAVVVAAVLIVPGILNRGGKNPVAEAAEATSKVSGVRMHFTMSAQGAVPFSMNGTGVLNGDAKQAEFEFSARGTTPSGVRDLAIKEIVDDADVYMNLGGATASLGATKPWILIRADEFLGDLLQGKELGAGTSPSPTQQLESLESASDDVAVVGHEQMGGVETTHYTAVIDMERALDQIRDRAGNLADLLEKSMEGVGNPRVDVWIDGQGLLRRETSVTNLPHLGPVSMTIDFTDYGIHPKIEVPPESEVYDMTPMFEQLLNSGGLDS